MAICVGYFEPEAAAAPHTFTVSGLVSSKPRWRQFEDEWTRALRHHNLESFSGRDFTRRTREFADGWSDPVRRRTLLDGLSRVADRNTLHAFSCSLALTDYQQVNAEYAFRETVAGPYGVCAAGLLACVRLWMREYRPDDLTLFVFEDGDIAHRELTRLTRLDPRATSGEPPQFWPRAWIDERGRTRHLRPMEACDLFAADCGRALVGRLTDRAHLERCVVDRDRLIAWCDALAVPLRRASSTRPAGPVAVVEPSHA